MTIGNQMKRSVFHYEHKGKENEVQDLGTAFE